MSQHTCASKYEQHGLGGNVDIKPGETYRNFLVRLDTAQRKLNQHEIKLPEEVQGWFVLRKLRLDTTSEAMVLTATSGSLKVGDIIKALKAVFPNGKGSSGKRDREVFLADDSGEEEAASGVMGAVNASADEDTLEVMEVIADQVQEDSSYESEDALEVYETYKEIKRKVQEKRTSRGFRSPNVQKKMEHQYQLQGSMRGKVELLKSRTKCHGCGCGKVGHWKKECPHGRGASSSKDASGKSAKREAEAHLVESYREFNEYYVLEVSIDMTGEKKDKNEGDDSTVRTEGPGRGSGLRDEWKLEDDGQKLVRIHHRPRRGLFSTKDAANCPVLTSGQCKMSATRR